MNLKATLVGLAVSFGVLSAVHADGSSAPPIKGASAAPASTSAPPPPPSPPQNTGDCKIQNTPSGVPVKVCGGKS